MLDWLAYSVTNGISSISTMTVIEKEVKMNTSKLNETGICCFALIIYT